MAKSSGKSIAEMKRENETASMGKHKLEQGLQNIIHAMQQCVDRGLNQEGIMHGGLNVKRRAKSIHAQLAGGSAIISTPWSRMNGWAFMLWR